MGLLDDAIREHLDLKRRRGADPLEVERDEREALGPVRRAPEAPDEPRDDEPEGDRSAQSFAYDQEQDEESWSHEDSVDHEPETAALHHDDLEPDDDEELGPDVPEFEPRAGSVPDTDDEREPRSHHSGEETIEYDVDDAVGSEHHDDEPRSGDDDVLEETPEFLQDTPDHDRLWFEQRPPKDFDFDG
jgi:hypothetical protein